MYYKDLEVWKEARNLVVEVYKLTLNFPKEEVYGLTSQIKRCAISIPSNIAEGCNRFSDKDTNKFIDIALGSIAELDTQLILAQDLNYIKYDKNIMNKINKVSALLQGLRKYLNNNSYKTIDDKL